MHKFFFLPVTVAWLQKQIRLLYCRLIFVFPEGKQAIVDIYICVKNKNICNVTNINYQ